MRDIFETLLVLHPESYLHINTLQTAGPAGYWFNHADHSEKRGYRANFQLRVAVTSFAGGGEVMHAYNLVLFAADQIGVDKHNVALFIRKSSRETVKIEDGVIFNSLNYKVPIHHDVVDPEAVEHKRLSLIKGLNVISGCLKKKRRRESDKSSRLSASAVVPDFRDADILDEADAPVSASP